MSKDIQEVEFSLGASDHVIEPRRPAEAESTRGKFERLRDEWKSQRGHEPSTMKVVMLPPYQKIIGIGPDALPFLFRELENRVDNWFWALMAITEEDPVPLEARGDGAAMARAWLSWARDRGIQW